MIRVVAIAMAIGLGFASGACSSRPPEAPANRSTTPPPPQRVGKIDASPGPLARSHEALDKAGSCNACHVDSTPTVSPAKCLDCHEHADLRARMTSGRGFHASPLVRGKSCVECHLDHRGRSFDLMGWKSIRGGMTGFDHDLTGWKLQGKHRQTACDRCHTARNKQGLRTFLGTPSACVACHQQDQPHRLEPRRAACDRCHSDAAWKPIKAAIKFDHGDRSDAQFPLDSTHARVECVKCHPGAVFATKLAEPGACERCHAAKSPHGNRFDAFGKPAACATCHVASWRATGFDHAKHTTFPLQDHPAAACRDCHRGPKPAFERLDATQATCGGCHRHPSAKIHDGKYTAAQCVQCHNRSAIPRPSPLLHQAHGLQGSFPLTGGHKAVACADCHTKGIAGGRRFKVESPECSRCHQDSHRGSKGPRCISCHVSGTWKPAPKSRK